MIKSMTAYGRAREIIGNKEITIELKSANHRYFEMYARVPRVYFQLEDLIRNYLQKAINRGKIDVNLMIEEIDGQSDVININKNLLNNYIKLLRTTSGEYELRDDLTAMSILRFPDVVSVTHDKTDMEAIWTDVKHVLDIAIKNFIEQRQKEGQSLRGDIIAKCDEINEYVKKITDRSGQLIDEYVVKLKNRIKLLLGDVKIDEQRIGIETAIMADKISIDEEIVRLNIHTQSLKEMFVSGDSNGKKMDFIIQEMNRETNTITSKIGDIDITQISIEIKTLIEKIREQVQNIE